MGNKLNEMGENGRKYLEKYFNIDVTYNAITKHFDHKDYHS